MSTIKSSAENLTLNADGANNDVIIQSNGSTKVTVDGATGNVGIGESNPDASLHITSNTPIISFDETDASQEYRIGSFGGALAVYDSTDSAYRMIIDGSGAVTMPAQPCVIARAVLGSAIPINTVTVIPLDSERADVGSNLTNNIFTAPVTGKYLYTYTLYFLNIDSAANSLGVQVVTSNKQYEAWISPDHIANADFYYTATNSQICDMDVNDTLQFKCYTGGGTAQTTIHSDSAISIALIC